MKHRPHYVSIDQTFIDQNNLFCEIKKTEEKKLLQCRSMSVSDETTNPLKVNEELLDDYLRVNMSSPLKINQRLIENYLKVNISDCIETNREVLDITEDMNYTHVIYVASWANLISGDSKHAYLNMHAVRLDLDCTECKRHRSMLFKLNDIATCDGYKRSHRYPGNILSNCRYIIHSNDGEIILSMWQIGISWKPIGDKERKSPLNGPLCCAYVKLSCGLCIDGDSLGSRTIWSTRCQKQYVRFHWGTDPIAKCDHIHFDNSVKKSYQFQPAFVNCLEVIGTYDQQVVKTMSDLLRKQVPLDLVMLIVDFANGLWLNLNQLIGF